MNLLCRVFGHVMETHVWGRAGVGYLTDHVCRRCGYEEPDPKGALPWRRETK